MAVRLSKVAREFNVGLSTIVDFLQEKGIKISSDPNAKLTDDQYSLVAKEFSTDSEAKKESNRVDLKNTRLKKETVTIDNINNNGTEDHTPEFISIKDEIKLENKIKVVDHIDLNRLNKQQKPEEKIEEKKEEKKEEKPAEVQVKETPPVHTPKKEQEETQQPPVARTPKTVIKQPRVENRQETKIGEKEETEKNRYNREVSYKSPTPAIKDVKVVGTIDLDAINQRTRPPKKSKQERERDKRELKKKSLVPSKSVDEIALKKNIVLNDDEEDSEETETRKKRKRILKKDEKINIEVSKTAKQEESKKKLKKIKKKKASKAEISEEDVQKQIKDTFARLGSKGKTKSSKHRRDKRDAVHQKMQAEMEQAELEKSILKLTEFVTVSELATMMDISVAEIISACMSLGLFVSINTSGCRNH